MFMVELAVWYRSYILFTECKSHYCSLSWESRSLRHLPFHAPRNGILLWRTIAHYQLFYFHNNLELVFLFYLICYKNWFCYYLVDKTHYRYKCKYYRQFPLGVMINYLESKDQVHCKMCTHKLKSYNKLTTLLFLLLYSWPNCWHIN